MAGKAKSRRSPQSAAAVYILCEPRELDFARAQSAKNFRN